MIDKLTNMKRIFAFLIMCLVVIAALAQGDMLRIGYEHHLKIYKDKTNERVDKYILHTDYSHSVFYNPSTYFLDKSAHDDAARTVYGQMASAMQAKGQGGMVPSRTVSTYVFKRFDDKSLRAYVDSNEEYIWYDEPFDEMEWEIISDSTRTVLNYECLMAQTDYHGRHGTAWFAPEIPVHDGPWKFKGLPGLILMAEDSTGSHKFVANGLEYTGEPMPEMEVPERYSRGDRRDFLKLSSKSLERTINEIKAMYPGANIKFQFAGGDELDLNGMSDYMSTLDPDFKGLETDY